MPPEPEVDGVAPAYYLDDPEVRALIRGELPVHPGEIMRNFNWGSWGAVIPTVGTTGGPHGLGRRFYTVDRVTVIPGGGWGYRGGSLGLGEGR